MLHDASRTFGAQNTTIHRVVTIALNIADLLDRFACGLVHAFAKVHINSATTRAHIASGLRDFVADVW